MPCLVLVRSPFPSAAQKAQPKRIPVTMAGGEQTRVIDAPAVLLAGVRGKSSAAQGSEGSTPGKMAAE
jgi:hypothetical protein